MNYYSPSRRPEKIRKNYSPVSDTKMAMMDMSYLTIGIPVLPKFKTWI
ncbi:hypothetical protein [Methanorbis rubei]